jgi:hypothetical protein
MLRGIITAIVREFDRCRQSSLGVRKGTYSNKQRRNNQQTGKRLLHFLSPLLIWITYPFHNSPGSNDAISLLLGAWCDRTRNLDLSCTDMMKKSGHVPCISLPFIDNRRAKKVPGVLREDGNNGGTRFSSFCTILCLFVVRGHGLQPILF